MYEDVKLEALFIGGRFMSKAKRTSNFVWFKIVGSYSKARKLFARYKQRVFFIVTGDEK